MADVDFDEFDGGYAEHDLGSGAAQGRARTMINMAGAVCSVALVIGLGVWGYKLAVRDVSGIPVVRALEGPLRIASENPGGEVASHQGLSVNAVAAAGTARPLPDKLILAPKEVTLAPEDQAGTAELTQLPAVDPLAGGTTEMIEVAPQAVASLAPVEIAPEPKAATNADAASLAVTAPLPATQEDAVAAALAAALADGEGADGGLSANDVAPAEQAKSPRPKLRPSSRAAAPVAEADAQPGAAEPAPALAETEAQPAPVVPAAAEIDPSTIPAGTRLVQLGAFDDEASARAEWAKLQSDFPDLLPGKAMVVQSAQSGGRTFYRLRAHGFDNEDAARQFCAAMLAQNASCIPVAQK
ncbi:SPOR domain-containing protein [Cypionkella sinensis]|uniref:SPOR domain-containing protein n=1 Tax=Cypionkella sinensis TaxID=1756043 RepID=A0ABV7IV81_9RHOB